MEKLKYYFQWWFESELPEFIERIFSPNILETSLIPVLIGPRRSGKSTTFFQIISQLRKSINRENIIYLNFEDDRLLPLDGKELSSLLDVYRQLYKSNQKQPLYLFFDEIQNVPNWEKTVRRFYETEKTVKLFLTGSNSRMLSSDIATSLRGRMLTFRVYPLSFKEYWEFRKLEFPLNKSMRYSPNLNKLLYEFDQYLRFGGFPEVVLEDKDEIKALILKEYFRTIFFADIVERYEIRQIKVLETFLRILTRQTAALFSLGKMSNNLKSIGFNISKTTVAEYLSYVEEAFLGKTVSIYAYSIKDQLQYPRKFYLIDNGLYSAVSFLKSEDSGRLLENLVFNRLQEKQDVIFYWKNGSQREVDFVLPDYFTDHTKRSLIQVCYNFSDQQTREREIRSLTKAAAEFGCKRALIITKDSWEELHVGDLEIEVLPYVEWELDRV